MKKLKISTVDKALIKAYFNWCKTKGFTPTEYECSKLIENMNCDHRELVENFINELKLKEERKEKKEWKEKK